jgi:hypothetical protein
MPKYRKGKHFYANMNRIGYQEEDPEDAKKIHKGAMTEPLPHAQIRIRERHVSFPGRCMAVRDSS